MLAKQIKSLQHPIIKEMILLRKNRSFREEKQQLIIFGYKIVEEYAQQNEITTLFITTKTRPLKIQAKEVISVSEEAIKKMSGMTSAEPIAALINMPTMSGLWNKQKLLLLDEVQDPGNAGTLIRSAVAFGWEGILFTSNSVDIFNDKTIRASKGGCLLLPYQYIDEKQLPKIIPSKFDVYIADIHGKDLNELRYKSPMILVLSNESKGVKAFWKKNGISLTIPIKSVESLNVAIAGSIMMYQMGKGS